MGKYVIRKNDFDFIVEANSVEEAWNSVYGKGTKTVPARTPVEKEPLNTPGAIAKRGIMRVAGTTRTITRGGRTYTINVKPYYRVDNTGTKRGTQSKSELTRKRRVKKIEHKPEEYLYVLEHYDMPPAAIRNSKMFRGFPKHVVGNIKTDIKRYFARQHSDSRPITLSVQRVLDELPEEDKNRYRTKVLGTLKHTNYLVGTNNGENTDNQ